jgi:hypothetical protein
MTDNYYAQKLNASNLYRVYETGIDRVKRYLDAEIDFVRRNLRGDERILELGAGYGRIMKALAPFAASVTGCISRTPSRSGGSTCGRAELPHRDDGRPRARVRRGIRRRPVPPERAVAMKGDGRLGRALREGPRSGGSSFEQLQREVQGAPGWRGSA